MELPIKFELSVMQVGNSLRITIPKEVAKHLELTKGDTVELWVDNECARSSCAHLNWLHFRLFWRRRYSQFRFGDVEFLGFWNYLNSQSRTNVIMWCSIWIFKINGNPLLHLQIC